MKTYNSNSYRHFLKNNNENFDIIMDDIRMNKKRDKE